MNWVDVLSLAFWTIAALWGLKSGLMYAWLPFLFLLAGAGFAGALGLLIGPALFPFIDTAAGQAATGFFLVFAAFGLLGAVVTKAMRPLLMAASRLSSLSPTGALFNQGGGLLIGVLFGCILLSVVLIGLQQLPAGAVGRALDESSFAGKPVGWVDRYVASLELSHDRDHIDE